MEALELLVFSGKKFGGSDGQTERGKALCQETVSPVHVHLAVGVAPGACVYIYRQMSVGLL